MILLSFDVPEAKTPSPLYLGQRSAWAGFIKNQESPHKFQLQLSAMVD
jgi:hypothetical protein